MAEIAPTAEAARLRLLYELGCAFAARVELNELCAEVLARCREVLHAEGASILLLDAERDELYFPYVSGENEEVTARLLGMRFPASQGIAGRVLRSGQSVRVDDVAADPSFFPGVDRQSGGTTRNLLCAPLTSSRGTIGVIQVLNRRERDFGDGVLDFLDALAGSIAVALENARLYAQLRSQVEDLERAVLEHNQLIALRQELDIARDIQKSILPGIFPPFPERRDFDLFAAMLPAREVGGDFYDFFLVDERRLGFVVADVSGKGVPAALFMAVSRTLLRSVALQGVAPAECLKRVNELLCLENALEMFVTVFYGVLDTATGEVEYANGGHNPPLLLRRSGAVEVVAPTGGIVLGAFPGVDYRAARVRLDPGDALYLYTDGVTEAARAGGDLFGDARLVEIVSASGGLSPEVAVRTAVEAVQRWSADEPQSDDITAMTILFRGP
jgi:serine phosphatase RsbU (regulator of sigma subunit)